MTVSAFVRSREHSSSLPPRARARGGRDDYRAQLRDLATHRARGLPINSRPLQTEGAGNAGRPMRPIAACAMLLVERTRVSQVTPESPGIPRAMVYGLLRALPGDQTFLSPSPVRRSSSHELDASLEASEPHDFAVRLARHSSKAHSASTASRPNVRDDGRRPSLRGQDGESYPVICLF
jgi:hypothetical protein